MTLKSFQVTILSGLALALSAHFSSAATLQLMLSGEVLPGVVYIAVYDGSAEKGWRSEPVHQIKLDFKNSEFVAPEEIELDEGMYAIRAYIDTNNNHQLDVNGVGYPREPVSHSKGKNRTKVSRKFKNAVFALSQGVSSMTLDFIQPKSRKSENQKGR